MGQLRIRRAPRAPGRQSRRQHEHRPICWPRRPRPKSPRATEPPATDEKGTSLFPFILNNLVIDPAAPRWTTAIHTVVHHVDDLNLQVPIRPPACPRTWRPRSTPQLSLKVNGAPLSLKGHTTALCRVPAHRVRPELRRRQAARILALQPAGPKPGADPGTLDTNLTLTFNPQREAPAPGSSSTGTCASPTWRWPRTRRRWPVLPPWTSAWSASRCRTCSCTSPRSPGRSLRPGGTRHRRPDQLGRLPGAADRAPGRRPGPGGRTGRAGQDAGRSENPRPSPCFWTTSR